MAGNVEQAVNHGPTASEYIVHHLQHMQYNFNLEAVKQTKIVDFSLFNADSLIWSILMGVLGCWLLWLGAR